MGREAFNAGAPMHFCPFLTGCWQNKHWIYGWKAAQQVKANYRFDVVAVDIKTNEVRVFARNKTEENAEAIIGMAVARRGVETEFYTTTRPGQYDDGDKYAGGQ